jgi:KDO2-lipid IV(A) lauroyltransferase
MFNKDATQYISDRNTYCQTAALRYYTNTPGDIHHRDRVIQLATAMLSYFGVERDAAKREEIINTIIINQAVADYDNNALFRLGEEYLLNELLAVEGEHGATNNFKQQKIYCGFHLGSYRLIVGYLLSQGVDLALLVTNDVIEQQVENIMTLRDSYAESCPTFGTLKIINAESFQGINDAIEFYQQGGSLLIYIDGNSGVGGMNRHDSNLLTIPFLNKEVKARKGVAFLSHVLSAEICPLLIENKSDGSRLVNLKKSIIPTKGHEKRRYIKETTQSLYQVLEQEIIKNISAWEGWLYIEKSTCPPMKPCINHSQKHKSGLRKIATKNLIFNDAIYKVLNYPNASILMNVEQLSYQVLSNNSARAIHLAQKHEDLQNMVSNDCISTLIQKDILIINGASNDY